MAYTTVNFRMDEDLKRNMEKVCAEMGLSMTTAFTIFAKKVTIDRCIPFEVSAFTPKEETIQEVEEMEKNPSAYKGYLSVEEMMRDILE